MPKEKCPKCGEKVESIELDRYRHCQKCEIERRKNGGV